MDSIKVKYSKYTLLRVITFSLSFFIIGCSDTVTKNESIIISKKELKSKTGKIYEITQSQSEDSILHNFIITAQGFLNFKDTIKFQNEYTLFQTTFADLDNNGFEELYIITKSVDRQLVNIRGIASYSDTTFGSIAVEGLTELRSLFYDVAINGTITRYWFVGNDSIFFTTEGLRLKSQYKILIHIPIF